MYKPQDGAERTYALDPVSSVHWELIVEPKMIFPHCPTVNLKGSLVVGVALQHNRLGA